MSTSAEAEKELYKIMWNNLARTYPRIKLGIHPSWFGLGIS